MASPVSSPVTAVFARRDPQRNRVMADQQFTARVPVRMTQQDAPLPINETRGWTIGRTFDRAWSHVNIFTTLNIQSINAIQAPNFAVARLTPGQRSLGQPGLQNPTRERTLITAPPTGSWGGRSAVIAPPASVYALDPRYRKLVG